MEEEKVLILAQLFASMKDSIGKIEVAYKSKDAERLAETKNALLNVQKKIGETL